MNIRAVVRIEVAVEYDLNDETTNFEAVAKEQVPRAINHVCSLIAEGQKHGVAPGVRFGVAQFPPTVTVLLMNPVTKL